MQNVTAEQCQEAAKGKTHWVLRHCSMCDAPLSYVFEADGGLSYNSNCDCVRYWVPRERRSWGELADTFNMQTPEVRERMWASFSSPTPSNDREG